jgi:hypothetical protein
LLFWKVKINIDVSTGIQNISLLLDDDSKPIVSLNNEIIIRSLVQHNIDNVSINTDLNFDSNIEIFAKTVIDVYASTGFSIQNEQINNLINILQNFSNSQFQALNYSTLIDYFAGSDFAVIDYGMLGVFKPSTAAGLLYFDYVEMIKSGDGIKFFKDLHYSVCDTLRLAKESGKMFSEAEIKEIIPLDYSQKKALRLSVNNSIVVQGPPGTGKSQTISNMIANFIGLYRSVLFVTEKKTAAGVVYNRLNRLRAYCLKFYEIDSDAANFTRQIRLGLDRIRELYGISAVNNSETELLNVASIRLDEIFDKLAKFKDAMKNEEGKKFPQFVIKYIENRAVINDGLKYIRSLAQSFSTSKDF